MFKRILVAVDGSEAADRAVSVACDLAGRCGSGVTLIHVTSRPGKRGVSPELQAYAESEHLTVSGDALVRIEGDRLLADAKARAYDSGIEEADALLITGDPATCIVEQARNRAADLIVMGQRGLGSLSALLMGSVSHKVAHLAPCACLVVK